MKKLVLVMAGAMGLLTGIPAWAHHGFAAEFDIDKPVKVRGAVAKWELVNPHSWLQVDVKGDDGKVTTWRFEGPPPNTLFRLGFTKDSLPPGTEVIVEGYAAKDGSTRASGKNITFPDGRTLLLGLATGPGAPQK
ncbi:MAG: DUF6152 family protein [Acidobacteriota bacterium]|nr:DUF6152 family protein [Acidobacteriota bacterium]